MCVCVAVVNCAAGNVCVVVHTCTTHTTCTTTVPHECTTCMPCMRMQLLVQVARAAQCERQGHGVVRRSQSHHDHDTPCFAIAYMHHMNHGDHHHQKSSLSDHCTTQSARKHDHGNMTLPTDALARDHHGDPTTRNNHNDNSNAHQ